MGSVNPIYISLGLFSQKLWQNRTVKEREMRDLRCLERDPPPYFACAIVVELKTLGG